MNDSIEKVALTNHRFREFIRWMSNTDHCMYILAASTVVFASIFLHGIMQVIGRKAGFSVGQTTAGEHEGDGPDKAILQFLLAGT